MRRRSPVPYNPNADDVFESPPAAPSPPRVPPSPPALHLGQDCEKRNDGLYAKFVDSEMKLMGPVDFKIERHRFLTLGKLLTIVSVSKSGKRVKTKFSYSDLTRNSHRCARLLRNAGVFVVEETLGEEVLMRVLAEALKNNEVQDGRR